METETETEMGVVRLRPWGFVLRTTPARVGRRPDRSATSWLGLPRRSFWPGVVFGQAWRPATARLRLWLRRGSLRFRPKGRKRRLVTLTDANWNRIEDLFQRLNHIYQVGTQTRKNLDNVYEQHDVGLSTLHPSVE